MSKRNSGKSGSLSIGGGGRDVAGKNPPASGPRRRKNRSTKLVIEFDPLKRKEFLTGFRKRKDERRKKAREQMVKDLKEEKKSARDKAIKDAHLVTNTSSRKAASASHRVLPEIEHLLPTNLQDFGTHTVTVTNIDDLAELGGRKTQKEANLEHSAEASDDEEEATQDTKIRVEKTQQKVLNKIIQKSIVKSRAFKASKQMKSLKDLKRSKFNKKTNKSKRTRHFNPKKIVNE